MRSERVRSTGDPAALAEELRALVPGSQTVSDDVTEIISAVRAGGDEAVRDLTRRFDTGGAEPEPLRVTDEELERAAETLDPAVRAALGQEIANVTRVGEEWLRPDSAVEFEHHEVRLRSSPVASAGVYVPAGRAPYPSTVVMGVSTALVAGVKRVAVCAPPNRSGDIDGAVLAACRLAGAHTVYRMGGAQAIAALAYGTESVEAVDVLVGPGNLYVQEAKRQLSGIVAIDGFAGPSDLVVIADGDADPEQLALDLLAQAEHGVGTLVIAISDDARLLASIEEIISQAAENDAVARLVEVADAEEALALAQEFAPEHIELVGARAEVLAPRVTRAGSVFVGAGSATAFGDYIAGSNHILPTGGAARFASSLSPWQFRRAFTEVRVHDGSALAAAAAPLARAEGFELHARSMEARIRDNGNR